METAVIYVRVSQDRAGGRSPEEQEAEARAECDRRGWDVVEVVSDHVGASRHSKGQRTGWRRVRELLAAGGADVLCTWEASRAQRDLSAYADLRDLCVEHGIGWCYSGRLHDLTDADDRFRTGLDALLAEREADEISGRVRRAMRANANAGKVHGRRLFGYQRTYDTTTGSPTGQVPHPDEAPVVQRIYTEYLGGSGIRTVARRLNDEGITTGTGARWNDSQVRRVLTNPAYVGRRVHQGQVVGEAAWPALVSSDVFDRVNARLAARRGVRQEKRARLLTGVARCGVCGSKLNVGHDRRQRKFYQCREGFCIARDEAKLDAFVTVAVLERLARPDVGDALSAAPSGAVEDARGEVVTLRGRLEEATGEFTAGRLSAATLARIEADLSPRIADAERRARSALVPLELDLPAPELVDEWWSGLTGEQCREVVAALISAVVVMKTGRGRRTFQPDDVRIEWRV